MIRVSINGKFTTSPPTGVRRVAEELVKALDSDPALSETAGRMRLVMPDASKAPNLKSIVTSTVSSLSGKFANVPWEQFSLLAATRGEGLLSLCNLGPVLHRRQIVMIHDAQVYTTPDSYSRPFRLWYKFIQPLLGRTAKAVLTVSDYSKAQLVKYGVAPADKIHVVHNGCDHILRVEPVADESLLPPGPYVLSLANTQAHKNIRVLLKAFARDELQNVTLVLYGAGTKADFEAKGCQVPDNVRFTGRIDDGRLVWLLSKASAFATPSLTEGFGIPPLEAMCLGCPVVAAPCGALPEACGEAALYADAHSPEQWAVAIRKIIDNPDFSADLRAHGQAHAAHFTWKRAATTLVEKMRLIA